MTEDGWNCQSSFPAFDLDIGFGSEIGIDAEALEVEEEGIEVHEPLEQRVWFYSAWTRYRKVRV